MTKLSDHKLEKPEFKYGVHIIFLRKNMCWKENHIDRNITQLFCINYALLKQNRMSSLSDRREECMMGILKRMAKLPVLSPCVLIKRWTDTTNEIKF